MADTAVAITAGTGTNIDTRTEGTNGNHRQVVVIGDPATNAGVAPVDATAGLKVDLGADNDVTVTGTVDLGATDNAVLDAIAASVAAIDTDATTIIGHVDGIETLLGTIDADTSNLSTKIDTIAGDTTSIQTAVELIDDTVYTDGSGTPSKGVAVMGTDGTNPQILKTDASGELQIDVLSMPTTTVTGTVAVTNATLTELGDAINSNKVDVNIVSSSVATGGTSAADDDDFTDGTTSGTPAMGVYESTPSTVTDGDMGIVGITSDRRLKVYADLSATDNAVLDNIDADLTTIVGHVDGLETLIGTTNTTLTTIDGRVDGIEALLTTIDADTSNLSVVGGGTEATAVRVTIANNSTGVLSIDDNGSTVSIDDGGGVITVDGTVAVTNSDIASIKTAVEILDNTVSGSEMQVDVVGALPAGTNAVGKLLAPDIDVTAHTNYAKKYYTSTGAATDGVVWSPAAGKRWHAVVIHFQVSADCTVTLEDDKAGGDEVVWKGEYKAGSGHTLTFSEKYPLASGEDAADLLITTSAGNIYLLAVGYEV